MPWVIKVRGDSRALITAEYLCPVHGRFEVDVVRDSNGDPPDEAVCGVEELFFDSGARPAPRINRCGRTSVFVISAPARVRKQRTFAARRGKDPERPANCMDWQALAYDEMSPEEWEVKERKKDFEGVRKIVKEALR